MASAQDLRVVTESYPPFVITHKGNVSGIVTKEVKNILDASQLSYSISSYPWARSFNIARTQKNTLIYSIIKSPERIPHFHWYCPIHQSTPVFAFKLSTNSKDISTIAGLKEALVGTARDGINQSYLQENGFEIGKNIDVAATEDINLKKFVNGRVDAVVQSIETITYRLNKLGYPNLEITQGVPLKNKHPVVHCMALNKESDPALVEKLNQAFDAYQQNK